MRLITSRTFTRLASLSELRNTDHRHGHHGRRHVADGLQRRLPEQLIGALVAELRRLLEGDVQIPGRDRQLRVSITGYRLRRALGVLLMPPTRGIIVARGLSAWHTLCSLERHGALVRKRLLLCYHPSSVCRIR